MHRDATEFIQQLLDYEYAKADINNTKHIDSTKV